MTDAARVLEEAFRTERAAVLATITHRLGGDLALAEDVVQDAFVAAAVDWDRRGVPERPGAWLTTTAWRRALDRLRHERVAAAHTPELVQEEADVMELEFDRSSLEDDGLRMIFTCCHPALAAEARMALTLRSVGGLTVPEIARAFLSSEPAMERRLTRARRKVTDARIPFRVPPDELLAERLAGVLRVVSLIYTEGHTATRGPEPVRGDLCEEAIRLARLLAGLMPDEGETLGLLALLLLTDARRPARLGPTASSSRSASRTARGGTPTRSRTASPSSIARCGSGPAPTSSRPRSPRCTRRRPTSPPRTGRRSPACTPSSSATTAHRS